jgi:hypothetical protein
VTARINSIARLPGCAASNSRPERSCLELVSRLTDGLDEGARFPWQIRHGPEHDLHLRSVRGDVEDDGIMMKKRRAIDAGLVT